MLQLLNISQLLLYIALLALLGQGLLYLIAGKKREVNFFYQCFQVINKPWIGFARLISFSRVASHHLGWVAFFIISVLYIAVTLAKIEHCISIGMEGCR
jgi:hypothetical protein